MNYLDFLNHQIRRHLLDFLIEMPEYSANNQMLLSGIRAIGINISLENFEQQIAFLQGESLLKISQLGHFQMMQLTLKGQDVAYDRIKISGIARPEIG